VPGRRIGQWVHDMGLVVEVDKVCFSSCANYIFPAGRGRVIRADSFVGWHGNERAFEVSARRSGKTLEDFMLSMLEPSLAKSTLEQRPDFRDQWGWGFTLADMEKLGLAHTSYLGDGPYEANRRFQSFLVRLTAEECGSLLR
jgi:hypothetical protein